MALSTPLYNVPVVNLGWVSKNPPPIRVPLSPKAYSSATPSSGNSLHLSFLQQHSATVCISFTLRSDLTICEVFLMSEYFWTLGLSVAFAECVLCSLWILGSFYANLTLVNSTNSAFITCLSHCVSKYCNDCWKSSLIHSSIEILLVLIVPFIVLTKHAIFPVVFGNK